MAKYSIYQYKAIQNPVMYVLWTNSYVPMYMDARRADRPNLHDMFKGR